MFANIRIRTIGWLFIAILMFVAGAFVVTTMLTGQNIAEIKKTWIKFEENRSEKAHALSSLRREIGYGGMIHAYKNYILRQTPELITQTRAKVGAAASALAHYKTFELSAEELIATEDISAMLMAYSQALDRAIALVAEGSDPAEIDPEVRIDDGPAIAGLTRLEDQVSAQARQRGQHTSKAQLVTELRRAMGYGGIIHDFKNAVLRGSETYFEDAKLNAAFASRVMADYLQMPITKTERLAITTIDSVIQNYIDALSRIRTLRSQGQAIREIDMAVRIDDNPALRAFDSLTREIVRQNDLEAQQVDEALHQVTDLSRTITIGSIAIIVVFGIGAVWLMHRQVLLPIRRQTEVMTKIAAGDFETEIPDVRRTNELGEMAQALAVFRLTAIERRRAERVITQFKTTLDGTQDCIFMFWPGDLRFFYVNQGAIRQVGYSEKELLNMTPIDLKPDFDAQRFQTLIQPLITGPVHSTTFETIHLAKSGEEVPVEIGLQYIAPPDEPPRFVAIVRDITERHKIDKAKSEFISTISHELRTPLTSIKGALGLIQSATLGNLPEKLTGMVDIALRNCNRLVLLINDILDLEKLEAGKMSFRMEATELNTLITEAIAVNQGYANEHDVALKSDITAKPVMVYGDKDRLMQVLSNLLSNGAKFSPGGSAVTVTLTATERSATIAVADRGIGIAHDFRASLFEKFTQADASDTRNVGGTGLGLSITRAILHRHGGSIDFESKVGEGTTFFCTLPLMDHQTEQQPNQVSAGPTGKRILICEDDADIAKLLELMLQNAGYETARAANAVAAKSMLLQENFDAMTLDLKLPDQPGISLLQDLRSQSATKDLPIVIISATANQERQNLEGNALDVVDWIEKPIDGDVLVERLSSIFRATGQGKPKILHIEDDRHIVEIVGALLGDKAEVSVAETLMEARALIANERFDLVLLDLMLPDGDGETVLAELKAQGQGAVPVVVFSARDLKAEASDKVVAALVKSHATNAELLDIIETAMKP